MKIGDKLYSEKHGIVTITGKKYQMVGNKSVFVVKNEAGKEVKLSGTEIPLSDHFENVKTAEKLRSEEEARMENEEMNRKAKEEEDKAKESEDMAEEEKEKAEKEELIETIESIEEKTKDYTETFAEISKNIKDFSVKAEFNAVVKKLSEVKGSIEGLEKPKDYTEILDELVSVVSKIKLEVDLKPIEKKLTALLQKEFPAFPKFPEIPKFELPEVVKVDTGLKQTLEDVIEDGRIKVTVDRVGGGGGGFSDNRVADADSVIINPATEETLQSLLAASGGTIYNYVKMDEGATYTYIGYTNTTGWQIKRMTNADTSLLYADGLFSGTYADFDAAWAARASITYAYTT